VLVRRWNLGNSTAKGSISANAPAGIRICGSKTKCTAISAATGFVLIGDPTNNCAANIVAGNIVVAHYAGGLVIVDSKITGGITAIANSRVGPLPGETAPIIRENHR
jgi:hypothetical protein